jgi:hypothetical protein
MNKRATKPKRRNLAPEPEVLRIEANWKRCDVKADFQEPSSGRLAKGEKRISAWHLSLARNADPQREAKDNMALFLSYPSIIPTVVLSADVSVAPIPALFGSIKAMPPNTRKASALFRSPIRASN